MKKVSNPLFSFKYLFYDFVKVTSALPGLLWFRPKWVYESPEARRKIRGGAILIANHERFFDPIYVMFAIWYRRHRFVCSKEIYNSKGGWFFRRFLCIPVDRENFALSTLRQIAGEIKAGSLISMFPEGHISLSDGKMDAFKSGMVLMALQGNASIIPIYMKRGAHFYNRLRIAVGERVDVVARYGPRPTMSQIEEVAAQLQCKEEELKKLVETAR